MGLAFAQATPPALVNYQGVLRDASDDPLDGTYDMRFLFFNDDTAGDEIIADEHLLGNGVTVTAGLFNVKLGGGSLADGSGPGLYRSLREVFRDYDEVWLEVRIKEPVGGGWETLTPRIQILSAGYALNANHLDGHAADYFLDTSSTSQHKAGSLTIDASSGSGYGIEVQGPGAAAYFHDSDASGAAHLGYEDVGVYASGSWGGGHFYDSDSSGYCYLAQENIGVEGYGSEMGGYFADTDGSAYAQVGSGSSGIAAYGTVTGGYFEDTDQSAYAWAGSGDVGLKGYGNVRGGYFKDLDDTGFANVADGNRGIEAYGTASGGYFEDTDSSGYAYVGVGDRGVQGYGSVAGGTFNSVGIGTDTPDRELHVVGNMLIERGAGHSPFIWLKATGGGYPRIDFNNDGNPVYDMQIVLESDDTLGIRRGAGGWGRLQVGVLEILGGADIAEPFPVRGGETLRPGAVVVIDPSHPGRLAISEESYDRRVAGVVSGAGGIRPGATLAHGPAGDDQAYVALTGRAYCLATAAHGPIRPGDLLTTSDVPGHAMRAADAGRSQGAILGKAMSALDAGEGLVLALVNLQ
jgi:hypothetical protein